MIAYRRTYGASGLMVLVALATVGCGGSGSGSLSGKVSYKGKPLTTGTIYVLSSKADKDTAPGAGTISADGSYLIPKAPLGEGKVYITVPKSSATAMPKAAAGMDMKMGTTATSVRPVEVPDKYSKPTTTPLTVTVKGGKQQHDINLD